jgi:Acetyltransferase (GNAT) family
MDFRYARLDEYPRISRFLHEYWAQNHVYCRMPDLFDWTFRRADRWDAAHYSFALAEDGGELAGILGGIPFQFNHFGRSSNGVWIVNYVIRPDHRKGSAALQLLSQFRRGAFDPVIAFGINPATSAIYRVLSEIPRHFLVLPEARERMASLLEMTWPAWGAERAAEVADAFLLHRSPSKLAEAGLEIPAQWDECEWPAIAQRTIGAARDSAYLTWRYRRHPVFDYRFLTVREGPRSGLAVWRLETIRKQTPQGRVDLDRIGRLVEFLPASASNAEALFSAFIRALRQENALGADFYSYHGQTRCWLKQLDFRETAHHPDGRAMPSRFQPLDEKGGGILSAMFLQSDLPVCGDAGDCPWYWTKSDSDQDRPN